MSDRAADYDAVRPDVWSHLRVRPRLGQLQPRTYRILDSEILHRLVEMGVLGLVAYLLMIVSVVLVGARRRSPRAIPLGRRLR